MKRLTDWLALRKSLVYLTLLFSFASLSKRRRATHTVGVGAKGKLKIADSPGIPEHDFFVPGREFDVQLRHANVSQEDDMGSDVRGCAVKLFTDGKNVLDLLMNTGEATNWGTAEMFTARMKAAVAGKLPTYFDARPHAMANLKLSLRRAPESYSLITYHGQLIYPLRDRSGARHCLRYRIRPTDYSGADSGPPDAGDLDDPERQERLPSETRPKDHLRQEFKQRLARGGVLYDLSIQIRNHVDNSRDERYDSMKPWDEQESPWHRLGTITLTEALPDAVTEKLRFNIGTSPPSLGVFDSAAPDDFHSIGYTRIRVYPFAQAFRRLGGLLGRRN